MWLISTISATITGKGRGEASVKLVDEEGLVLSLNKIEVDLGDGANPIKIAKDRGTPVYSGSFVDGLKDMILEIFQESLKDKEIGLYQISDAGIEKL